MKNKISVILRIFILLLLAASIYGCTVGNGAADGNAADIISQMKQQLSAVFDYVDQETAGELFSFFKDKITEGSLNSEEGILSAIEEGKEKFGVEISREDAQKLVDTMEKLEGIGFSPEYVVDKAESLYQQYGADFVEHVDEVVTDAVKSAASNAAGSFFDDLKNSIKSFFDGLFS